MSESTVPTTEALFRANKRRKIYRKRNIDDQDDEGSSLDNGGSRRPESVPSDQMQTVIRPISKKHGIGFSTAGSKTAPDEAPATPTAVVPFQPGQDDDRAAHDRFVKPAGKAAVIEDKHLTAYVDSKLAELRSSNSTPILQQQFPARQDGRDVGTSQGQPSDELDAEESSATNPLGEQQPRQRNNQRIKPSRPRRGPPQRDARDIARDDMVDQIMRESQVPIYDQSGSGPKDTQSEDFDPDEAAAAAFRAEFLLNMEEQQNRRRPAAPPVQQRGAAPVPTGPKLGGSRAQREKMKAIEEAKAAGKTVDAVPKRR